MSQEHGHRASSPLGAGAPREPGRESLNANCPAWVALRRTGQRSDRPGDEAAGNWARSVAQGHGVTCSRRRSTLRQVCAGPRHSEQDGDAPCARAHGATRTQEPRREQRVPRGSWWHSPVSRLPDWGPWTSVGLMSYTPSV